MVGDFGVGKTSLTRRYVNNIFSDRYLTTVGVKIETKKVDLTAETSVKLVIWDIAGEETITSINRSYMRGMSGYLLVADGTRPGTVATAEYLQSRTEEIFGFLPFSLLLNKADLEEEWAVGDEKLKDLQNRGWRIHRTSAKTGAHVDEAFAWLAAETANRSSS